MYTRLGIFLIGLMINIEFVAGIDCFHCAYIAAMNSTSPECISHNTTAISACSDSMGCIQLSYQYPETNEYASYFLGCGTTECNETNSDGVETVQYNLTDQNYTLRKTCCKGDYCNCNSATCNMSAEAHKIALENEETTPSYDYVTDSEMVDCFHCVHNSLANVTNSNCTEDKTTSRLQCPGNLCMKYTLQYNNGSTDYILYTLDCASNRLCNQSVADGVERSNVSPGSNILEKVTCCEGDHCNCNSPTCLEAGGITTTTGSDVITSTIDTTYEYETTVTPEPMFTTVSTFSTSNGLSRSTSMGNPSTSFRSTSTEATTAAISPQPVSESVSGAPLNSNNTAAISATVKSDSEESTSVEATVTSTAPVQPDSTSAPPTAVSSISAIAPTTTISTTTTSFGFSIHSGIMLKIYLSIFCAFILLQK
ncbi:uncharacterized protein LOC120334646 [Styela clava]